MFNKFNKYNSSKAQEHPVTYWHYYFVLEIMKLRYKDITFPRLNTWMTNGLMDCINITYTAVDIITTYSLGLIKLQILFILIVGEDISFFQYTHIVLNVGRFILEIEPRASHMPDTCSVFLLYPGTILSVSRTFGNKDFWGPEKERIEYTSYLFKVCDF